MSCYSKIRGERTPRGQYRRFGLGGACQAMQIEVPTVQFGGERIVMLKHRAGDDTRLLYELLQCMIKSSREREACEMTTLDKLIAEVNTFWSVAQYCTWLAKLNKEDFALWTSWPTAEYFCRGAIEEEQRKRGPARYSLRLKIELVPSPCWDNNLRESISRTEWDKLRKQVYARYQWRCGICDTSNVTLHCHEIWQYDDKQHIQKLAGFICLCPMCHHCKHMGKAGLLAAEGKLNMEEVISHFMRVNQCSREEYEEHSKQAWDTWRARSKHQWTTDLRAYAQLVNEQR